MSGVANADFDESVVNPNLLKITKVLIFTLFMENIIFFLVMMDIILATTS